MSLPAGLDGVVWLLASLLPFILVQRWLHRELQGVFLLLTRRHEVSVILFALIFLPGVLLHELSHFVMAKILRVPTGRFSVIPQVMEDGQIRMGYVEIAEVDFLRDSLIGAAPLISGGLVVAYLGLQFLGLGPLAQWVAQGNLNEFFLALGRLPSLPDFWVWFYLAFVVSSMMLPSPSDRTGWPLLLFGLAVLAGLALLGGLGPWLSTNVLPALAEALRSIAIVFGIGLAVNFFLAVPVWMLRKVLSRITGLELR